MILRVERWANPAGPENGPLEDFPMPRISAFVAVLTLLVTTGALAAPKDQGKSDQSCYSQRCYEECSAKSGNKDCENTCERIASTKPPCK
jgi:hypothetical protein